MDRQYSGPAGACGRARSHCRARPRMLPVRCRSATIRPAAAGLAPGSPWS